MDQNPVVLVVVDYLPDRLSQLRPGGFFIVPGHVGFRHDVDRPVLFGERVPHPDGGPFMAFQAQIL
ncbi:MAG: hypothetical protein QMD10_10225, partial [Desulfitobacteriaceae bacterium]|nr:hypothetical protein [Desulfitobacteriaceae bacterium]